MCYMAKKEVKNCICSSAECYFLVAGGFFCSFDVLHGGLGINILQFLIKTV
jgi:hypothetical protein